MKFIISYLYQYGNYLLFANKFHLTRWLAKYKVVCECEGSINKQVQGIIGDNLRKELLPLLVKDDKTDGMLMTNVPLVVVENLKAKVCQLLDELERCSN